MQYIFQRDIIYTNDIKRIISKGRDTHKYSYIDMT